MPEAAELLLWAKGFAAGFAIAAPLGPTAILCIRRTLDHGRLFGFATGLAPPSPTQCSAPSPPMA